jgi:pimeloyl-ACP methyl ester carboxylesterase
MSRLLFLLAAAASALLAAPAAAAPFKPSRISVAVRGTGPDVILIPGLASSSAVWNGTVAAVPGYRYHLVQVAGFAGTAPGGNVAGPVAAPVPRRLPATSPPATSAARRSSAIRWAGRSR